jgi:hypothetical protein
VVCELQEQEACGLQVQTLLQVQYVPMTGLQEQEDVLVAFASGLA